MKFALALAITLALAMAVQSSVLPWSAWNDWHGDWDGHLHGHDDGQWHGDWHGDDGQWHGDWHDHDWHDGVHGAIVVDGHHAHHGPALVVNGHNLHAHAPIVHLAHPHHEGHYIAKTRGAVHTAPLAGHAASAASINLQPAPGTV